MSRLVTVFYPGWRQPFAKRAMCLLGLLCVLSAAGAMANRVDIPATVTTNTAANNNTGTDNAGSDSSPEFLAGVNAYREGNYLLARKTFAALHKQMPEDTTMTYYLAIAEAQLGHFAQARKLYQEISTLDPNGEAGRMASEGLQYLPGENGLDHPPRFQSPGSVTPAMLGAAPPANGATGTAAPQTGMSPQDMMMLQMMMSQPNGNNQQGVGGFNMLPYMMMPQAGQTGAGAGASGIDPQVMSNMLMNQMLQNFSMDSGKDQN
jgi:hypothetical protein